MNSIEDLLTLNNIDFETHGDEIKCRCLNPDHHDKKPSCYINRSTGQFYCFSCGYKGGAKTLEKLLKGETLSQRIDYKLTFKKEEKVVDCTPKLIGDLKPLSGKSLSFAHSIGCSDEFIRLYQVKEGDGIYGISKGLWEQGENYTPINRRIVIPIYDENSNLINYEARTYSGDKVKVLYLKGCKTDTLFNFNNIDKTKPVVLTESIKNLMRIWNVNTNVVSMFHAIPTEKQLELLNKIPHIIFFADFDAGSLGGVQHKEVGYKKGGLQTLLEGYYGELEVVYMDKIYRDATGKIKGWDANDCDLEQLKQVLSNRRNPKQVHEWAKTNITW